jgi:hypothetical protein
MKPGRHQKVALAVLAPGMLLSYCWYWAADADQPIAWNIVQAGLAVYLLAIIGLVFGSADVWAAAGLIAVFKLMVIGCSVWYLMAPWPIVPGQALCSARLNWPLGFVGLALGVLLTAKIARGKS